MIIKIYFLTFTALFVLIPPHALCWSGTVITGPNDNTITVERDSDPITIRLYGINTLERSQAKKAITSLIEGRQVTINELTTDKHGQPAALVYISGQILNKYLIQEGYAQVDTKNCKENFCSTWV